MVELVAQEVSHFPYKLSCAQYSHIRTVDPCGRQRGGMPSSASNAVQDGDIQAFSSLFFTS